MGFDAICKGTKIFDVEFEDDSIYDISFCSGREIEFPLDAQFNQASDISLGHGLKRDESGKICVDTADAVERDNTLPVTSAAVFVELGNVEALLMNI